MEAHRILNGRYRVEELIGRGGMADVFRGVDLRLKRTVAVKLMRPDLARDPHFQARFRQEARHAAALNHPSIVAVYDTGEVREEDGQHHPVECPFLVLEHVSGQTLREILAEGGVTWRQAVAWTRSVLEALDHAHDLGIVHRDVKPANVMVSDAGEVKVTDFGIARALADTSASTSQQHAVVGTALYLPPEQATGGEVDARSDLYAVACLLFELLTGRPPFTGDTPLAIAYQHVREEPPAPSAVDPALPPAFDPVVLRGMSKDPADRYASGAEFLRALEAAAADPYDTSTQTAVPGASRRGAAEELAPTASGPATAALPLRATAPAMTAELDVAGGQARPGTEGSGHPETGESAAFGSAGHAVAGASLPGAPSTAQLAAAAALDGRHPATGSRPAVPLPPPATAPAPVVPAAAHRAPLHAGRRLFLGFGAALLGLLLLLAALSHLVGALDRDTVAVPDVRGLDEAHAVTALEDAGLHAAVQSVADGSVPEGQAAGTDPAAGTSVARGTTVRVRVARGASDGVLLPASLHGAAEAAARQELARLGLTVSSVEYRDSGSLARGQVLATEPAIGSRAPAGSAVVLHLSSGMVRLPSLVGMTAADARAALRAAGEDLDPRFQSREPGASAEAGVVVGQSPEAGARVDNRSSVTLTTSTAAPVTQVPASPQPQDPAPTSQGPAPVPAPAPTSDPTSAPAPAPSRAPSSSAAPTAGPTPGTSAPASPSSAPGTPTTSPSTAPTESPTAPAASPSSTAPDGTAGAPSP